MQSFVFKHDPLTGQDYYEVYLRGRQLLNDPHLNKDSGFSPEERAELGLEGLVRSAVTLLETQVERAYEAYQRKADDLERYIFLIALQDRNEVLFYRLVSEHLPEMMPVIYTPTVGQACLQMSHIQRRFRGIYITPDNIDRIDAIFRSISLPQVNLIIVTDGERILGLGDLGSDGMGIPVGKVSLYVAAAGVHPCVCLPVCLDVGTDNARLREDPIYLGYRHPRLRAKAYDGLIERFVQGVKRNFPNALLQWEDFAKPTAFQNLARYQERLPSFNDDIQGTGATALAALLTGLRIKGSRFQDERFLIAGMGQAGIGIASHLRHQLESEGLSREEARSRILAVDRQGLLLEEDPSLDAFQRPFAQPREAVSGWAADSQGRISLAEAVRAGKPSVLIGVSAQPGLFSPELLATVAGGTERPIILALSGPASKGEATPEAVWKATNGRALLATGSPFPPVEWGGRPLRASHFNTMYVFPGLGLGALAARATRISDGMFLAASRAVSAFVTPQQEAQGLLLPDLKDIRRISAAVALAVAREARDSGLGSRLDDEQLAALVARGQWEPRFTPYRAGELPSKA
jgi:malate dehydrogenase (oxaloacetate-decarboxylating)